MKHIPEPKIEKGIPLPPSRKGYSAVIRRLKKGESVFFELTNIQSITACYYQLGLKGKITCRSIDGGVRVWRIK